MCHRILRKYRCGHSKKQGPDGISYCDDAAWNSDAKRMNMCNGPNRRRTTKVIADSNLCGKNECWINDLKNHYKGWTCCRCGEMGNDMEVCEGPPGGNGECPHPVCVGCKKTY